MHLISFDAHLHEFLLLRDWRLACPVIGHVQHVRPASKSSKVCNRLVSRRGCNGAFIVLVATGNKAKMFDNSIDTQ